MQHKWKVKPEWEGVYVAGNHYKVVVVENLLVNTGDSGCVDHKTNTISIEKSLGGERRSQVLCHEIDHAIDHAFVNNDTPEFAINGHSEGWWQVLRQFGVGFEWDDC